MLKQPETNVQTKPRTLLPPLSATKVATLFMFADTLAILGSGYFTYDAIVVYSLSQNLYMAAVVFVWITSLFLMNFGDLYRYQAASHPLQTIFSPFILVLAPSFLFLLAAAFSIKISETFSRLWLGYFVALSGGTLILFRLAIAFALARLLHVSGLQAKHRHCRHRRTVPPPHRSSSPRTPIVPTAFRASTPIICTQSCATVPISEMALPPDNSLAYLVSQARWASSMMS